MNFPYFAFGILLLALTGMAEYRGWTFTPVNERK